MFKVKNVIGGVIPVMVGKISVTLKPGRVIDLGNLCSMDFINNSEEIQGLLRKGIIERVPDLPEPELPEVIIIESPAVVQAEEPPKKDPPKPRKYTPRPAKAEERKTSPIVYTQAALDKLSFNTIRNLASGLGLVTHHKKKQALIDEILKT